MIKRNFRTMILDDELDPVTGFPLEDEDETEEDDEETEDEDEEELEDDAV